MSRRNRRILDETPDPGKPDKDELSLKAYGYILANARANPLRAGATITAVAVAVTFLIVVGSISVGLEGATQRELLDYTLGTPELPISDFFQTEEGDFVGLFATTLFDPDEVVDIQYAARQFLGSAEDATAYPYSERVLGRTPFTGLSYHVERLIAVDPGQGVTTPYTKYHTYLQLANGQHLEDLNAREVVLGHQLWKDRYPDALPGATIDLTPDGEIWFDATVEDLRAGGDLSLTRLPSLGGLRLVGIMDRDLSTDRNAYVPLGYFADLTGAGSTEDGPRSEAISVEVDAEGADMEALTERLLDGTDRMTSFFLTSATDTEGTKLAEALSSAMVGMVLGIANTSFLTVSQRVREIGTLRALGLSRDQVRKLVQWEALFIGMMGWVIGFFAGTILASSVLNVLYEAEELGLVLAPGRIVPFIVVGSVLAVIVAAFVGAEIPARKASRMSPMEALSAPL